MVKVAIQMYQLYFKCKTFIDIVTLLNTRFMILKNCHQLTRNLEPKPPWVLAPQSPS